jgi:polyphosphate kinase
LLTCDPELGADATDLFNVLTGLSRQRKFRRLLVAPMALREAMLELIEAEIQRHAEEHDGRIVMKLNAIVDPSIIEALYRASRAGVPVDLIVRGACSLRPGVEGVSETIRVRSIIGRFLEHSRIFTFGRGERERFYIGSADMMERNLDRRVEALAPVDDPLLQERLRTILELMLADDRRAWQLGPDDRWRRVEKELEEPTGLDTFETLISLARASVAPVG